MASCSYVHLKTRCPLMLVGPSFHYSWYFRNKTYSVLKTNCFIVIQYTRIVKIPSSCTGVTSSSFTFPLFIKWIPQFSSNLWSKNEKIWEYGCRRKYFHNLFQMYSHLDYIVEISMNLIVFFSIQEFWISKRTDFSKNCKPNIGIVLWKVIVQMPMTMKE